MGRAGDPAPESRELLEHQTAALVIAHPGHELLLHHWMERARPIVFALTDGSGGSGVSRSAHSARVVTAAGGRVGPVFGAKPDREWYEAILGGDRGFFCAVARTIGAACVEAGVRCVVTDSVEYFNPMHDLCAALASFVARSVASETGCEVGLFDYPIEQPNPASSGVAVVIELDRDALERKRAAATSIPPLASEVARHLDRAPRECLRRVAPDREWPRHAAEEPHYERVGRERIARSAYDRLITYEKHVRPLALGLSRA